MKDYLDRVLDSAERVVGQQRIGAPPPHAALQEAEDNLAAPDAPEFEAQPDQVPEPVPEKPALIVAERPAEDSVVSVAAELTATSEPEAAADEPVESREPQSTCPETKEDGPLAGARIEPAAGFRAEVPLDPLTRPWKNKPQAAPARPSWSLAWVDAPSAAPAPGNPVAAVPNIVREARPIDVRYFLESPEVAEETAPADVSVAGEKKSSSEPAEVAAPATVPAPPLIAPPNTSASASREQTGPEPSTNSLIIHNLEVRVVTRAPDPPARPAAQPTETARQTPVAGAWASPARRYAERV